MQTQIVAVPIVVVLVVVVVVDHIIGCRVAKRDCGIGGVLLLEVLERLLAGAASQVTNEELHDFADAARIWPPASAKSCNSSSVSWLAAPAKSRASTSSTSTAPCHQYHNHALPLSACRSTPIIWSTTTTNTTTTTT